MAALTSKFYTTIPHAFGMRQPPVLTTIQAINAKVGHTPKITEYG